MSTGSILSILAYPQYGYHLVFHTGLSLVHCSYLSVGSLHRGVKADEGRRLRSGTGRVRTRVRVREGRRQGAEEGRSPRRVSVGCCKHYGASPDESRPSGS